MKSIASRSRKKRLRLLATILCERKSVYSDIDALNALGYDIRLRRGRSGGYWMATRPLDVYKRQTYSCSPVS